MRAANNASAVRVAELEEQVAAARARAEDAADAMEALEALREVCVYT